MAVERRVRTTLRFQAAGGAEGETVRQFTLERVTEHQRRDKRQNYWLLDSDVQPSRKVETVQEGLSRRDLEALVNDAVSWLAYDAERDE